MNFISSWRLFRSIGAGCGKGSAYGTPLEDNQIRLISHIMLKTLRDLIRKILFLLSELFKLSQILLSSRPLRNSNSSDSCSPIVLIHGLFGSQHNWNLTCKKLAMLGDDQLGSFHPIVLPSGNRSVAQDVELTKKIVADLASRHPTKGVHLLGHSRGGLIALLCGYELNEGAHGQGPVISIATLASPLKGSPLASWVNIIKFKVRFKPFEDLALRSEMVRTMARLFDLTHHVAKRVRVLHLVSERDLLVPSSNQTYLGIGQVHRIPSGHMGILIHKKTVTLLHKWLSQIHQL